MRSRSRNKGKKKKKRIIFPKPKKNTSFQTKRADQMSRSKNEERPRVKYWFNFRIPGVSGWLSGRSM